MVGRREDALERLKDLFRSGQGGVLIVTEEEAEALDLVRDALPDLPEARMWTWSAVAGIRDGLVRDGDAVEQTEHPAAALYHVSRSQAPDIHVFLDLADHLEDGRTKRALREAIEAVQRAGGTLVLIDHRDTLPPIVRAYTTEFDIPRPDAEDLEAIVRATARAAHLKNPIHVELKRSELSAIVRNLLGLSRRQARRIVEDVIRRDDRLDAEDLDDVIAMKRQLVSSGGILEFVQSPASLDSIGGLDHLKSWLVRRERSFDPDAESFGLTPPRGVLLLGVQGAGKSLCAKAIATAWRRPLLRLDPGALYDRYVGQSEKRLRDSLKQAERMSPVVLWIDEIEKAFASAAAQSTDGGLSQRMFGTLLTWMQEHTEPVFLVATANNIEALPPELMRKGRFDEIFFVDLPGDAARRAILEIHLAKRDRDPVGFDLDRLVRASEGYSGAEIEQAVVAALHGAFDARGELDTDGIERALRDSPPLSVTMRERIESLRRWAEGRCVPAG